MRPFSAATNLRLSRDGRRLVFVNGSDVYVHDLERGTNTRVTFTNEPGELGSPCSPPDCQQLKAASTDVRLNPAKWRGPCEISPICPNGNPKTVVSNWQLSYGKLFKLLHSKEQIERQKLPPPYAP